MDLVICFAALLVIFCVVAWIVFRSKEVKSRYTRGYSRTLHTDSDNIQDYGINQIRSSGKFTPAERAAEYRRRGKSPSGVIDGIYNDTNRGNEQYNDTDRDWDADA